MTALALQACDHGTPDDERCPQCAAEIRAGESGESILVGGAAPAVDDAHEHFHRVTIDEAPVLPSQRGRNFTCAACVKPKSIIGRKLQRVDGMRQYVCKGCAR